MAVPGTIFGINSDSVQKILESVANEPKLQARLLVALHYFADKFSKSPARVSTSSGTSSVYDPSTNSPPQNRPVRSKIGQIVAGKRTPEVDEAGADEDQIWRVRRAERKALREEGQRLAQELDVEHIATSRWKFHRLKECTLGLRADEAAQRKKKHEDQDANPTYSSSEKDRDPASRASTVSSSDSPPPEAGALKAADVAAMKAVVSAAAEKAAEAAEKAAAEAAEKEAADAAEKTAAEAAEKAAEKAAAAKKVAAERAAVEKASAEKTAAAKKAAAGKVAAAKEVAAERAAAEKATAEAAGKAAAEAAERTAAEEAAEKGKKKKKRKGKGKGTRGQPRNPSNSQFVAAPPIPTTSSTPGREEVHAQEAAEFESVRKAMAAGGKCHWSESELGERYERLKEYEFEKQIRRDQDPNPSLIKGDDNHLYTREEVLASELEMVLNPGIGQWVSVRQLRNNFHPPESWIRSSRRS